MNYQKHYSKLVERARNREISGYFEHHHVIPHCMGGGNDPDNLVKLTPEEHYLAHQLLVKIYPSQKGLIWAVMVMTGGAKHQPRRNKLYGWLRRRVTAEMIGKPRTERQKELLRVANLGRIDPKRGAAISRGKKGKKYGPHSAIHCANISKALTGKTHSAETRAKQRAAKLGKKQSPEHVAKVIAAILGSKRTAESRLNMVKAWEQRKLRQLAFALC